MGHAGRPGRLYRGVEECFDNDQNLQVLAADFYAIMDAAARFTVLHKETLAQLPWAGDNYTAAAVFPEKLDYDSAMPRRPVELSLDFEKEMREAAADSGFGGWAHGVAGGDVHGNSAGNVYLAGIEIRDRRFLVGVGEGFGRSTQAFGDINPKAAEIVVYTPDWKRLDADYKKLFEPAVTRRGEEFDTLPFRQGRRPCRRQGARGVGGHGYVDHLSPREYAQHSHKTPRPMIQSFQFARLLAAELRGGTNVAVWPDYREGEPYYRVAGRLDTGALFASVEIRVWQDFSLLKQLPPAARCDEPWMSEGADWHNSREHGMCWVLREVWRDGMDWEGKRALAILVEGRQWLLNDVRCLINRHYSAFRDGLTRWPKEWSYWGHYARGSKEYAQLKPWWGSPALAQGKKT